MILERLNPQSFSTAVLWLFGAILTRLLYNKYGHGLNNIPGPWLAGYTDLWRLFVVRGRRAQEVHIELHKKYGPAVRLGPRAVSIADTEALKIIYSPSAGWSKSKFYPVQQALAKGKRLETMFNTANDRYHARLRRSVSNAYAMSTLVTFEPFVDSTSTEFIRQLKLRFADRSDDAGVCDFGAWLQFYAFDVIGELTFSKRLGFVEGGVDIDNIIRDLESFLNYVSWIGQIPFLDNLFIKNPIKIWMVKQGFLNSSAPVAEFARKHLIERQKEEESGLEKVPRRDFLNRFKEAHKKDPDFITEQLVLALTVANMFAGSDTTGITLRAVFYYLLKDPSKMNSLLKELATESKAGRFSRDDGLVQWEEVRDLPYLSAVINEALRCHPAVGLTLERIVPEAGVTLAGHFIPGGSIVGCSPWVIHQDTEVYGADASACWLLDFLLNFRYQPFTVLLSHYPALNSLSPQNMAWSRLIRFLDENDQVHLGDAVSESAQDLKNLLEAGNLTANELVGTDLFDAKPTGKTIQVKRLLGPLTPQDVPIIRCVGLNYAKHIKETGRAPPPHPSIFIKPSRSITGWSNDIPIPKIAQKDQLDYEGELAIVIGKEGKDISVEDALSYVAGYTVANDVSARTWQRDPKFAGEVPQWCFSKGFNSFAPLGPVIVSPSVLGAADELTLQTKVNGEIRQEASTNDLVFGVKRIIEFVSQGTTLEKGSVILTGTPGGVALGMKPPQWLKDGDVVEVFIGGIGTIRNKMVFQ